MGILDSLKNLFKKKDTGGAAPQNQVPSPDYTPEEPEQPTV